MRSSGHETFACRYTWIPKAFSALSENPGLFSDDAAAMVRLGLGKNMVRSLRFWIQIMGVAEPCGRQRKELKLTSFGRSIFNTDNGLDPYMEDVQTLWLLHWKLASHPNPLLAWDYLLYRRPGSEIVRSVVIDELLALAERNPKLRASRTTITQHFDMFKRTYVASNAHKRDVLEDTLDCPLVELHLVQEAGEKIWDNGKREPVYAFRRERKPEISVGLFLFGLNQFWNDFHPEEQTLALQQIVSGEYSPGKIFALPEVDIRARLENIERDSGGYFTYVESVALQQLRRKPEPAPDFLSVVYGRELARG